MAQRRLGQPDEVAAVVAFIASSEASYMSGAVVMLIGFVLTLFFLGDTTKGSEMTPSQISSD